MTQNVRKSKMELTGPNTVMNRRMNVMSHAAGRASASGSTRSVGITICQKRVFASSTRSR